MRSSIINGRFFKPNSPPTGGRPSTDLFRLEVALECDEFAAAPCSVNTHHPLRELFSSVLYGEGGRRSCLNSKCPSAKGRSQTGSSARQFTPAPKIVHRQVLLLADFNDVTVEEVAQTIRSTLKKQRVLDPIPTLLVKDLRDVLAPIITSTANT